MFQSLAGVGIIHQNELVPLLFLDSLQVLIGSARVTGDKTGSAAEIKKNENKIRRQSGKKYIEY